MNLHWDAQVNETLVEEWNDICEHVGTIRNTEIDCPCFHAHNKSIAYDLHMFDDARHEILWCSSISETYHKSHVNR